MASPRLPVSQSAGPRRQPGASPTLPPGSDASYSPRQLLLRSWPGRLFLVATVIKFAVAVFRDGGDLPAFVQILSTTATLALAFSVVYFLGRFFVLVKRQLLWRVRRKLILSYIFIGVVPALLIIVFFLIGGITISQTVSVYLFHAGHQEVIRNVALLADAAASEIARTPARARETVERTQRNGERALGYATVSIAFVPASPNGPEPARAGRWEHVPPPTIVPDWVKARTSAFSGTIPFVRADAGEPELAVRAVSPAGTPPNRIGWVIADVPLDATMLGRIHQETGIKGGEVVIMDPDASASAPGAGTNRSRSEQSSSLALFGRGVSFFDTVDWDTGRVHRATIALTYRVGELYDRLARAQSVQFGNLRLGDVILLMLAVVAALFLIIQTVALIMGLALARSITSSIHELFMGTERVRQGDFTHRINIATKDQLGELAESFNQMTGSIENLLQTAAEKKRLEEELRIARQIQMSLLPRGPLDLPGVAVTALCVPAREVGGDYYDFFPLAQDRLGVLIADVAGKGTSAALYMAELKGLVLSLSQIYQSPRQLLVEVNRIISANLDSRSFITMTYAVLDIPGGLMTYARAGHTPLIHFPGPSSPIRGPQVLTPNGMVLGLRIEGAEEKFAELLEEDQIMLNPGDVIVLYTDGITEAMNASSDLFGESRLSKIIEEHGHLDSGELRERILREIEAFVGGADQHDDMTMILMKILPAAVARMAV
jgi:sigma-B regulation protein RsbU (phosphoserine phosphatase)